MYTTEQGYKVTIFHSARNKQYSFTKLGSRSYVESELTDLGFSLQDIADATYTQMAPEEIQSYVAAIEADWDNY